MKRSSPRPFVRAVAAGQPSSREGASIRTLSGLLGLVVIGGTLAVVRLWALVTRTPFYKD